MDFPLLISLKLQSEKRRGKGRMEDKKGLVNRFGIISIILYCFYFFVFLMGSNLFSLNFLFKNI